MLCIPAMHDWSVFIAAVVMDNILVMLELAHNSDTNFEGLQFLLKGLVGFFLNSFLQSPKSNGDSKIKMSASNITAEKSRVIDECVPSSPARLKSATADATTSHLPEVYRHLSRKYLLRIEHYFMALWAKMFGLILFCFLLPVFYLGPNHGWYGSSFSFSQTDFFSALQKGFIALGAMALNGIVGMLCVRRVTKGVNVLLLGLSMISSKWLPLLLSIYLIVPAFPYTQLGKQWSVVTFIDGLISK